MTPRLRASQLHRPAEQLHPPPNEKKPAHAFPQRIRAHRRRWAHQSDQQAEDHIVLAGDDRLVRTDQHRVLGKLPAKLSQRLQKPFPTHIDAHHAPPSSGTPCTPNEWTITITPLPLACASAGTTRRHYPPYRYNNVIGQAS